MISSTDRKNKLTFPLSQIILTWGKVLTIFFADLGTMHYYETNVGYRCICFNLPFNILKVMSGPLNLVMWPTFAGKLSIY